MAERSLRDQLHDVAQRDIDELVKKDAEYGSSWRKRGGAGAFFMLARKFDRLEKQVESNGYDIFTAAAADERAEGIRDDIGDLRRYLMLVETAITVIPPSPHDDHPIPTEAHLTMRDGRRIERPFTGAVIQPWRCPQTGERVWDDLHKRIGTVTEVLQDGDAGIRFDNGKPPYQSKWHRMWVLLDQTRPDNTGQEHPFGYQAEDNNA